MDLHDLNDETRRVMIEEFRRDVDEGRLYLGRRLNDRGRRRWPAILEDALNFGNPGSLADSLRSERLLTDHEIVHRNGKPYERRVPSNAEDILAEGEFVRFYMRAICARAIASMGKVQVYRAKPVNVPRPDSASKIGQLVDPTVLLDDLRTNIGLETMLGLPPGPNTGLCVRLG